MSRPYKHVQAILTSAEAQEVEDHIVKLKKSGKTNASKQEFIRETILREVRKNNDESL